MLDLVGILLPRRCVNFYPPRPPDGERQRSLFVMVPSLHATVFSAPGFNPSLDSTLLPQSLVLMRQCKDALGPAMIAMTHPSETPPLQGRDVCIAWHRVRDTA
jgi:peptide/nickel transport system ATP-binding protein